MRPLTPSWKCSVLSESGYTQKPARSLVDHIISRTGSEPLLVVLWAPDSLSANATTSPGLSTSSPSGCRSVSSPEMTSSHSSSVSQWYGQRDWPGGSS